MRRIGVCIATSAPGATSLITGATFARRPADAAGGHDALLHRGRRARGEHPRQRCHLAGADLAFRRDPAGPCDAAFRGGDTGVGIAQDQGARLFEPFEQAGTAEQRVGGTGLGLAISRQLLRMMGGEIQLESRFGEGSRFWFDLSVLTQAPG